jgi:hypothetical protein
MKTKYKMIIRYVYIDGKERLLVQLFSINSMHQKEMLIYGTYKDIYNVESAILGKCLPEPWQGAYIYKQDKLGKKVWFRVALNNDKINELKT